MPEYQNEPEIVEATPWVEATGDDAVESVAGTEYVADGEYVEGGPVRRKETLAEAAAEGPLDWPDDGSRAEHQGYIDHDGEFQLHHNPPVVEEHHGRDGILDDDISLAIAEEMGQRGGMI